MNVEDLLRLPEGKTLEFKASLGVAEPLLRTVVAFANTAGQGRPDPAGGTAPASG